MVMRTGLGAATPTAQGLNAFTSWYAGCFHLRLEAADLEARTLPQAAEFALRKVMDLHASREAHEPAEVIEYIERHVLLQAVDRNWQNHLTDMDELRRAVNLRSYAQKDPLNEYKSEAFALFNAMLDDLKERVLALVARAEIAPEPEPARPGVRTGALRFGVVLLATLLGLQRLFAADDADASVAASTTKIWCADASKRVMASALQVHGGIGFTWEHDLHFSMKRAHLDQLAFGDAAVHRARLVELLRPRVEAGASVV